MEKENIKVKAKINDEASDSDYSLNEKIKEDRPKSMVANIHKKQHHKKSINIKKNLNLESLNQNYSVRQLNINDVESPAYEKSEHRRGKKTNMFRQYSHDEFETPIKSSLNDEPTSTIYVK